MKKKIYKTYYFFLGLVIFGQVAFTLYQTSLVVAYGYRQKKLQIQAQTLAQKKQELELKLAETNSLLELRTIAREAGYQPITEPIQIITETSLASAQ